MTDRDHNLSAEETQALNRAEFAGTLTAQLYRDGVFSEPDFVLLGVLQRLAIRGRLQFRGLGGDRRQAAYTYAPVSARVYAPTELARNAA